MKAKVALLVLAGLACGSVIAFKRYGSDVPISTGKLIDPPAANVNVGSFPGHMVLSPDGKYIVVSNFGFRQQLSVLDAGTGNLVSSIPFKDSKGANQMYFGIAFGPEGKLYVSEGGQDQVGVVDIASDGTATLEPSAITVPSENKAEPNYIAGLALTADGKNLLAVGNESYFHKVNGKLSGGDGNISVVDLGTGKVTKKMSAAGFPFDVTVATAGPAAGDIYSSSERDNCVLAFKSIDDTNPARIATGANCANLLLNKDQTKLYASNPGSDTISVIDTATNQVSATILLRPAAQRGLPGVTPLGMALSPDGETLYAAAADLNAVVAVDTDDNSVKGYIPAGWYPTSVIVSPDGQKLYVANAKGINPRTPNDKEIPGEGTYILNILEGTVSAIDLPQATSNLPDLSKEVLALNRFNPAPDASFIKPPIRHVIYIVKENRTYDQVFGDVRAGNGDPSVCMFPKSVTPNEHSLAQRFVLLDNFYTCAEVSADGWNWSTAGTANDYVERNTIVNYAGRGRDYDFEGTTNEFDGDRHGVRNVGQPEGGYIWDACNRAHVSFRNYGFFVSDTSGDFPIKNKASAKGLFGKTDNDFRQFDTAYADSDAWVKLHKHAPKQMLSFGSHNAPCRFTEWKREFDRYVRNRDLPTFEMLRLMRDHTAGTAPGVSSPRAMVADNDYAVGEVVDAVSHSPYWKDTVICILEDDSQAGQDHVDCHRSTALLVSPYIERGMVEHRFYNTDSMLRTIEDLLGQKPMCQYDGFASPINVFRTEATNSAPYTAIMPSASILNEVNTPRSYRARESAELIDRFDERDEADLQLNEILMGDFKRWKRASSEPQPLHG